MRFIFTFLVVAVAALTLTWYIGYDYNMYEYRLIKSIVVKVHNYFKDTEAEHGNDDDSDATKCHSWYTLNILMEKLFKRTFDTYGAVYQHPSHKLSENLTDDIKAITFIVDNFHSRLEVAIHSLPEFLFPARAIFESMQANLIDTKDKLVNLSDELLGKIDADYSKSRRTLVHQFAKFLLKMGQIVEKEQDSTLECVCAASVQLDVISEAAMENVHYCIDDAEFRFRAIYNSTKHGLNLNLDHTIEVLTDSYDTPVSMFDNFFHLPIHVSIPKIDFV